MSDFNEGQAELKQLHAALDKAADAEIRVFRLNNEKKKVYAEAYLRMLNGPVKYTDEGRKQAVIVDEVYVEVNELLTEAECVAIEARKNATKASEEMQLFRTVYAGSTRLAR